MVPPWSVISTPAGAVIAQGLGILHDENAAYDFRQAAVGVRRGEDGVAQSVFGQLMIALEVGVADDAADIELCGGKPALQPPANH